MVFTSQSARYSAAIALLLLLTGADAFWRLPCRGRTGLVRVDPLMNPGTVSQHVHALHGGSNLGFDSDSADMRASNCTSCGVTQDNSGYWTPAMYFEYSNGSTTVVPQVGGMLVYYLLLGDNVTAFPDNFSMVAGDTWNRNFSYPIPDIPKSDWTADDKTQKALAAKSIGFNCLNYTAAAEGTLYRHFLPDKAYIDANCLDGIRAEIMMPSCWNGQEAADHRSHVAYPDLVIGGECPPDYNTQLPSLLYETIWNTYAFHGQDGRFVMANGDPTGDGYHADFLNGWKPHLLQQAIGVCTNQTGNVEDCPLFDLQDEDTQRQCSIAMPSILDNEDTYSQVQGLPGNVRIDDGPAYASPLPPSTGTPSESGYPTTKPVITSAPTSLPTSAPSLGYAPGTNFVTDNHGGVITVAAVVETTSTISPITATSSTISTSSSITSADMNIAPVMPYTEQHVGVPISTRLYTDGPTVHRVVIDMIKETVVVDIPTPTPETLARRRRRSSNTRS